MTAGDAEQPLLAPTLTESASASGVRSVQASGRWDLSAMAPALPSLQQRLHRLGASGSAGWDLRGIVVMDHVGAALFWDAWGRRRPAVLDLRPEHELLFRHFGADARVPTDRSSRARRNLVERLGRHALAFHAHLRDLVLLVGALTLDLLKLVVRPSRIPWREISANIFRTGTQALGITALVGFLVGVVLSFLSANQLKLFGADVFIINILGVSITRELGPVLAAILVAGRSGSSMTAQLGVMRVTQELDALSVMGIPHTSRLILPKIIGLALTLPLLILWTNAIALLGGMLSAYAELGIGVRFFLSSLPDAVPVANLWLGVGKGFVFGVLIALLACHYGLRIRPNTESLGAGTTRSVVTAITVVILVDAVFAIVFRDVGLAF